MTIGDYIIDLENYDYWKIELVKFKGYSIDKLLTVHKSGLRKTFAASDKDKTWTYPIV